MNVVDSKAVARLVERNPLAAALALSLIIHLSVFGGWQVGKRLGWWQHQPTWLVALTKKLAKPAQPKSAQEQAKLNPTIPMTFVEIDPDTAVTEEPKDAKLYSTKNTKASNPDPKDAEKVKVDGKQEQVVRVMENEKPKPFPLQPTPQKPAEEDPAPEPKPKADAPGDLALLKPKPKSDGQLDATTGDAEKKAQSRPRTITEAKQRKGILTGDKLRQEGGVSSKGSVSFDVKASPFGDYDAAFISAVERCWHLLLDDHQGTRRPGKVVVDFKLTSDGRITEMKVAETDVGDIQSMLCQSAILNPAPYPRWPAQMRQTIAGNTREIRFTFYYN